MATVGLSPYVTNQILLQVENIFAQKNSHLPAYPTEAPAGVGDEAFSILLPPNNEKEMLSLIPDWAFQKDVAMFVGVKRVGESDEPFYLRVGPDYYYAPYHEPHIRLPGKATIRNVSGIAAAVGDNGKIMIAPATDGSTIKLPHLRDFVANIQEVDAAYANARAEIRKAKYDMETFLKQHRTLNKAVKAFGPSLMEFVPKHIQDNLQREPVQRKPRPPKAEPITVDIDHLVAAATTHKLKLH